MTDQEITRWNKKIADILKRNINDNGGKFAAHLLVFELSCLIKQAQEEAKSSIRAPFPGEFTVPTTGIYEFSIAAKAGTTISLGKFSTKSIEVVKPKWYEFWKPVVEKHFITPEDTK